MKTTPSFLLVAALLLPLAAPAAPANSPGTNSIPLIVRQISKIQAGASREALSALEKALRSSQPNSPVRAQIESELVQLLSSDASPEAKRLACRFLAALSTETSLPILAKLLQDERTTEIACSALHEHPSAQADAALRAALPSASGPAQLAMINTLADRRDPASVKLLQPLAAIPNDSPTRQTALSALGRIGTAEAAQVLDQLRQSFPPDARTPASAALLECAQRLARTEHSAHASALLKKLNTPQEAPFIQRGALVSLIQMGGPQAVEVLFAAIRQPQQHLVAAAIAQIPSIPGGALTQQLAEQVPQGLPEVQLLLIAALGERRDAAARPVLARLAAAPQNGEVALAALRALTQLGGVESMQILVQLAASADPAVKAGALNGLRQIRGDAVDSAIREQAESSAPELRGELISVLTDRGIETAVPFLLAEIRKPLSAASSPAWRALGRLANPGQFPVALNAFVRGIDPVLFADAELALIQIAGKTPERAAYAAAVAAAYDQQSQTGIRLALLRIAGALSDPAGLRLLERAAQSSENELQETAIRALAEWPDAQAIQPLLEIARRSPAGAARVLALRGYLRLLALPSTRLARETLSLYQQAFDMGLRNEEKKLVLAGLSENPFPSCLTLIEPLMSQPGIESEATLAALGVVRRTLGHDLDRARSVLQKIAGRPEAGPRAQAEELLKLIQACEGWVVAWNVTAPYALPNRTAEQIFDIRFSPEDPAATNVTWQVVPAGANAALPSLLDLARFFPGEQRAAYARTWIHVKAGQKAQLQIGSDDGVKVWLNQELVHQNNTGRAAVPGQDKADVALRAGWNELLFKITQQVGPWGFCVRLTQPDGTPLPELKIDPDHSGS